MPTISSIAHVSHASYESVDKPQYADSIVHLYLAQQHISPQPSLNEYIANGLPCEWVDIRRSHDIAHWNPGRPDNVSRFSILRISIVYRVARIDFL